MNRKIVKECNLNIYIVCMYIVIRPPENENGLKTVSLDYKVIMPQSNITSSINISSNSNSINNKSNTAKSIKRNEGKK